MRLILFTFMFCIWGNWGMNGYVACPILAAAKQWRWDNNPNSDARVLSPSHTLPPQSLILMTKKKKTFKKWLIWELIASLKKNLVSLNALIPSSFSSQNFFWEYSIAWVDYIWNLKDASKCLLFLPFGSYCHAKWLGQGNMWLLCFIWGDLETAWCSICLYK